MDENGKTASMINIVIVDDHPLVRSALKTFIEKQGDMKVIAEASNGEEAIALANKLQPNVIIMDI